MNDMDEKALGQRMVEAERMMNSGFSAPGLSGIGAPIGENAKLTGSEQLMAAVGRLAKAEQGLHELAQLLVGNLDAKANNSVKEDSFPHPVLHRQMWAATRIEQLAIRIEVHVKRIAEGM